MVKNIYINQMNQKIIGIVVEDKNSIKGALIKSIIENFENIFSKDYLYKEIYNIDMIKDSKKFEFLVIIGSVPLWFRKYKNKNILIHVVCDKYTNDFYKFRPVHRFNKFFAKGMLKSIYNENFTPDLILVNNKIMKYDYEIAIDFYKPLISILPYITKKFNANLRNKLSLEKFNRNTSYKEVLLYNSTIMKSIDLKSRVLIFKKGVEFKNKYIISSPYKSRRLNKRFSNCKIVGLLNFRFTLWDYVIKVNRNFFKAFIYYLIYNLYFIIFSIANVNYKKDNILFSFFIIFKSLFNTEQSLHIRWKGATKLQLAAGLKIPLITQNEYSISEGNLNEYPVLYYKNIKELDNIYNNNDWEKLNSNCKKKGEEFYKIYEKRFKELKYEILNLLNKK